jgi:indole-3-acetate monooxygenase
VSELDARERADPGSGPSPGSLAAARQAALVAAEHADAGEAARRLPGPTVEALRDAGLFRLCVPAEVGGLEAGPWQLVEAIEAVATADGAAGWCLMIGATSGSVAAWLDPATASEVYGPSDAVTGGVFAPKGRAVPGGGGARVTGRWPWGSGSQHCTWLMGGCLLDGDPPSHRMAILPASEVDVVDTWHATGLRGTGSHDLVVDDRFVPQARLVDVLGPPRSDGPLYRFPFFGLLAVGVAGVALGIARSAVDALTDLAGEKVPTFGVRKLGTRSAVQADVARAEALIAGGRALLHSAVDEAWEAASTGTAIPVRQRAALRLAATSATRWSAQAVDHVHDAAGGTAVLEHAGPIARCFRDVHVVTQHVMVAPPTYESVGRVLLGLDDTGGGL